MTPAGEDHPAQSAPEAVAAALDVCAVVLTWNDTEMAGGCIQSLYDSPECRLRVILVDNGSASPCGEILGRDFPDLDVVTLPTNRGFAGGCNAGIERALETGADYVFLLNNDTLVDPGAASRLREYLEDNPRIGAASALIVHPGPPPIIDFYKATVNRNVAMHKHLGRAAGAAELEAVTGDTEFLPACAVLYRSTMLKQVGLFDEDLFVCWEDYDHCLRITDHGWRMATVVTARVEHLQGATTGRASPYITYYFTRNWLICLSRYGSTLGALASFPRLAYVFLWHVRRSVRSSPRAFMAFLGGIRDFLLGVRGRGNPPGERRG